MSQRHDLLSTSLRDLPRSKDFGLREWDRLLREARAAGLLGRIALDLEAAALLDHVPEMVRWHLDAARILAQKHLRDVRWEVECIKEAAKHKGTLVLLKGAAYVLAELPAARGRLFNDIDLMVPAARVQDVEVALLVGGWRRGKLDSYDERYYRDWMHEIPPLTHTARGTTIDLHHTIIPKTARVDLRADKLFAAARPLGTDPVLRVLAPADMILHSATHLLNEGEFNRGLRDLHDITLLLGHFCSNPDFWPALLDRAAELDLRRPLFYALRYSARLLGAQVPKSARDADRLLPPNTALRALMDALFERALRPDLPDCRDWLSGPALFMLYVRAHHLRMPARLLVPHLIRKAYIRRFTKDE